jgi:hypothetical protein
MHCEQLDGEYDDSYDDEEVDTGTSLLSVMTLTINTLLASVLLPMFTQLLLLLQLLQTLECCC